MDDFARDQHVQTVHEAVDVPTDDQSHPNAQHISNQKKGVGRESGERLFRFFVIPHDGILNRLRNVGVVREIFTESRGKVPDANHKKCENDRPAREIKRFPQMRFDHGDKKCRQKQ